MAGSLNKVQLIGNLGKDPEIRYGQDGSKFASFSVATSERWKDKATNEVKDKTEWHRVVVFNDKLADVPEKRLQSLC
jgi:single-strand DNA-binding protein